MSQRFEIQYVSPDPEQAFVIARKIDGGSFWVGSGAKLHQAPVISWDENLMRVDPRNVDGDTFAFALTDPRDLGRFSIGLQVLLEGARPLADTSVGWTTPGPTP